VLFESDRSTSPLMPSTVAVNETPV